MHHGVTDLIHRIHCAGSGGSEEYVMHFSVFDIHLDKTALPTVTAAERIIFLVNGKEHRLGIAVDINAVYIAIFDVRYDLFAAHLIEVHQIMLLNTDG